MSDFKGSFEHTIDSKGRINIPSNFRKQLSPKANETFVIIHGPQKSLFVYPENQWNNEVIILSKMGNTREGLLLRRRVLDNSSTCSLDTQGRIIISKTQKRGYLIPMNAMAENGLTSMTRLWRLLRSQRQGNCRKQR